MKSAIYNKLVQKNLEQIEFSIKKFKNLNVKGE
jgi:hypothetical protein